MTVLEHLQHVVVAVKDVDAAAADWEKYFAIKAAASSEDSDSKQVRFNVGDGWVALAQPKSQHGYLWDFLQARGQGVCTAAVQVSDVDAVVRQVEERGASVQRDASGRPSVDPRSANGVRIELWPVGLRAEGPSLFRRFHHLVVATHGTQAAAGHWRRLFDDSSQPQRAEQGDVGHIPAGPARKAYFGLVDGEDHPAPVLKFLNQRGEGVYIVSVVDDTVDETVLAIRERGARIVGDMEGKGQLFVHPGSTHGVLLEINDEQYSRNWTAEYGVP